LHFLVTSAFQVRKATSEKLYVALLAIDPFCDADKYDSAAALLTDTIWYCAVQTNAC
jgi:hypothetical protein